MSRRFENLRVDLDENLEEKLHLLSPGWSSYRILRKSVDARKRHDLHEIYSIDVFDATESPQIPDLTPTQIQPNGAPPLIVGAGPAGLFAALRLVERGVPCHLFERGSTAQQRILHINRYWRYGELSPHNNVCFGEGGAGLYSDGKLITRIKSPYIPYVMDRLIRFGAPEEIRYLANPHVGSDRIRRVIPKLREFLLQKGCIIHFDTPITQLLAKNSRIVGIETAQGEKFLSDHVILATGHSANDIFDHLKTLNVALEEKDFAVGLRIEHPQKHVDQIQYRQHAGHPRLGAANYKLTHHDHKSGIGVYSFCMCPGGYVLPSSTEITGAVSNGMSNYHRNSPYANAAVVVSVSSKMIRETTGLSGLDFRTQLEQAAHQMVLKHDGKQHLPTQTVLGFLEGKDLPLKPSSCLSGIRPGRLDQLFPQSIVQKLKESLVIFDQKMKGFIHPDAQLLGVESRTSCPLRIVRDETTLESTSHAGLYPAGEGAGYAGGITSAACDGIRIAEEIVRKMSSQSLAVTDAQTSRGHS